MISVGLREMKANLSRYVRLVQEQQTDVSVTSRGKTVARLVPASAGMPCARDVLVSLAAKGLLELPAEPRRRMAGKPIVPKVGGQSLSEMIVEDRR
jgi:prevent-host-death family protein